MKTLWSILVGCCVVLVLWGCNGQPQQTESQDTPQAAPKEKTRPFVTKWKSNGEEDIQIPIIGTYTLTWYNEATPNERHTEQVTVEIDDNTRIDVERVKPYSFMPPTEGVYVVEAGPEGVEGIYMTFYGSQQIYAPKLLAVVQFGDVVWTELSFAFSGCENMQFDKNIDIPNLQQCRSMTAMFTNSEKFNSPLEHWDVSQVNDMWCMFSGCALFNQPLNHWNVSKVETMGEMFKGCTSFDQSLDAWNISSVNKAHKDGIGGIFDGCPAGELPFVAEWKAQGYHLVLEE